MPLCLQKIRKYIYIPVWFYYDYVALIGFTAGSIIYIPVWFYYDSDDYRKTILYTKFTFQYGSIMTEIEELKEYAKSLFTFQYGSIMTISLQLHPMTRLHLHSSMVLLWLESFERYFAPAIFTFQYGSIMTHSSVKPRIPFFIYIPVWFYYDVILPFYITDS